MAKGRVIDFEWAKRANNCIAQAALTNSKRPESFVKGVYPTHLVSGAGVTVKDTAGNTYADYICGLGTNLLGYGNASVIVRALTAMQTGATLSLSSTSEIVLAEKVREIFPFVERVKLLKSGTEGCLAAIRIARAATGRSVVLSEGYHGWGDEFVSLTPPATGVCGEFSIKKFEGLSQIDKGTAAVILEPVITDSSEGRLAFLRALRKRCQEVGAVLIFDETITGLRFPKLSVAAWASVYPDILIFGKALANGLPLSCVAGTKEVMEGAEYFVSASFAGERASIEAAIAVLTLLQKEYRIDHLWNEGLNFIDSFNEIVPNVKIEGYATRGVLKGEPMAKAILMQECCRAGLLFGASWFYAFPHIGTNDVVMNTLRDIVLKIKTQNIRLDGEMPQSPFAQKVREQT
jgi:glutamate-1-semialdehyde 2,1-aminomutase